MHTHPCRARGALGGPSAASPPSSPALLALARRRHVATAAATTPATPTTAKGGSSSGTTTPVDTGEKVAISGVPGRDRLGDPLRGDRHGQGQPARDVHAAVFVDGVKAYFDWRNSEGGIYGRKLAVTTVLDDEVANNQAKSLEIVSANDTFGTFSAPLSATGRPIWPRPASRPTAGDQSQRRPAGDLRNVAPICFTCTSRPAGWVLKEAGAKRLRRRATG